MLRAIRLARFSRSPNMANWSHNNLTLNGPAHDVAKGLWLARHEYAESARPDVRREILGEDGVLTQCFEFETPDCPPQGFLRKLSAMLPRTLVKCAFSEPFGGVGGFFAYRDGELWECQVERFTIEDAVSPASDGTLVAEEACGG
jgi:hypothetical protein